MTLAKVLAEELSKTFIKYNVFGLKIIQKYYSSTSSSEGLKHEPVSFGMCNSAGGCLTSVLQCSM